MASTPPPLPSSDEGEFDDDDFGCFTSSAPIKAGVDSESEDDVHHIKGHSQQNNFSENDASVKSPSPTPANSNLESDARDIVCNGSQASVKKSASGPEFSSDSFSQPGTNSEVTIENLNATSSANADEGVFPNSDRNSCSRSAISDLSSDVHDSPGHDKYTPELCEDEEENCVDISTSEIQGSGSSQQEELDDWADFTPAPSLSCCQGDQVKEVTVEFNTTESFQPSDQNNESLTSTCISAEIPEDLEIKNGVSLSDLENFETVNKTNEAIEDACDIENEDENHAGQSEDEAECRSGNNDFAGNQSPQESDVDVNSYCENVTRNHANISDSVREMNDSPNDSNREVVNGSDDDFGDFSDFPCQKAKENSSEEDVAPISFRTSTCEEDLEEEDVDHNDFNSENAFTTHSDGTGESPFPYGVDNENDDDDWGFKAADDNVGDPSANDDDDFGDFGSVGNAAVSDDANWADFSNPTTPAAAISDHVNDLDEDEFQSPTSSLTVQALSVQDGQSKLEKAISSSFPHDQQILFHQYANKNKKDDKSESENEKEEDTNALDSVLEMGLKVLPSAKQETWTITKEIRIKDPMVRIWEHLKDVNACHALDFGWNSSQCSQEVYSTLHIDTQNVLFSQKKQAVPFFASGLGILEPIRGGANPPEKQNVPPPQVDTRTQVESQKEPPQDIPPVDFDWSSSGLTDPLKVLKSDGFNSGLSSFEPFAEILQKSAAANQGSDKELSPEARSILKKIPNLSFMQSKVLMFPIKDA